MKLQSTSLITDTPPHTKLVQVPYACCLILTSPVEKDNDTICEVISRNWSLHFPRTQYLNKFLNPDCFNGFYKRLADDSILEFDRWTDGAYRLYPSIDRHGRITYAHLESNFLLEYGTELKRRIGLLNCATTSFVLHHNHTDPDLLDKILANPLFDYVFYDTTLVVPSVVESIRTKTKVPIKVLDKIYNELAA